MGSDDMVAYGDIVPPDWSVEVRYEGAGSSTLDAETKGRYRAFVGPHDAHAGQTFEGWGNTREAAVRGAMSKVEPSMAEWYLAELTTVSYNAEVYRDPYQESVHEAAAPAVAARVIRDMLQTPSLQGASGEIRAFADVRKIPWRKADPGF